MSGTNIVYEFDKKKYEMFCPHLNPLGDCDYCRTYECIFFNIYLRQVMMFQEMEHRYKIKS